MAQTGDGDGWGEITNLPDADTTRKGAADLWLQVRRRTLAAISLEDLRRELLILLALTSCIEALVVG